MDPGNGTPGELQRRLAARLASPTRYKVLVEIASGSMGRIFKVRDLELGRELAMKVLDPGTGGERMLAQFLEEARLTSQLDHPGIVSLYDVGVLGDGRAFYTMPLVEGRTLDEVLKLSRSGAEGWSRLRVLHALLRACEALAYAHERGVVHRDLKPANLMVGRHGEVLVLDWGLARHERHARGGALGGTPATMAPDLLAGKSEIGPLADVYAFGAILYCLCAGHLPYEDAGEKVDFGRILRGPPTPLAALDPALPLDLIAITEKAMARDPRARYASMQALREDLERFLEGRIVHAHPVGRVERLRKWLRRNPQLGAGVAVAFVLLLALVLLQAQKVRRVSAEQRLTQRKAYVANLAAADASLRVGETGEAKRRLLSCAADLRGWEWRHLWLRADSAELVLAASEGRIDALAAAPDAARIATGAAQRVVLWDAAKGERLAERPCGASVVSLAYSPAGDELAAGLADGVLLRLDARDLAQLDAAPAHEAGVSGIAYSPSGEALASLSQHAGSVRVARAGEDALVTVVKLASTLAFLDEDTLAVGSPEEDGRLHLLDTHSLAERAVVPSGRIQTLARHPQGRLFAAGAFDGRVLVIDAVEGVVRVAFEAHPCPVNAVAWDPSGRVVATAADDKSVRLWNAADGAPRGCHLGHDASVKALAFLPGGERLVSGAADGTARIWRAAGGADATLRLVSAPEWVESVAFLTSGQRLVTLDWEPALRVWNSADGARLASLALEERAACLAVAPAAPLVAYAIGHKVLVHHVDRQQELSAFDLAPAHALALAFDEERVLARTSNGELIELTAGAAPRVVASGLDELGNALDVASEPGLAAVGRKDGSVLVIDVAAGAVHAVWPACASEISALAFDSSGGAAGERLLAGAADGTAVLIDVGSGQTLATLHGHDDRITAVAFGPGARLATASKDLTVRIWDGAEPLLTLRGHSDWITDLAVDATGNCVASAARDGTVRLWRAPRED